MTAVHPPACRAFAVMLFATLVACGGADAPSVVLQDLDDRPVHPLEESDAKAFVFLFARTDCPISNRYAPEVGEIHREFAARGVRFWLVYVDPDQPAAEIRAHQKEYGYPMGALRDPDHALVRLTGAEVTPEAVVFSARGEMVYRGRIDDRYADFGRARPEPTRRDLRLALEAVLAGKRVEPSVAPAVGCYIPDLG